MIGRPIRVLMMPDYTAGNPYQRLLARALENLGVKVDFWTWSRPFPLLHARHYDVLHLHWHTPYVFHPRGLFFTVWNALFRFPLQLFLLRSMRIPVVYTVHELSDHEAFNPWRVWIEQGALRSLGRLARGWIVHCSRMIPAVLKHFGIPDGVPVAVIPHGSFRDAYTLGVPREEARRRLNIPLDIRMVLLFGAIRLYKQVPRWIRLFRQVAGDRDRLYVVGEVRFPENPAHITRAMGMDPRIAWISGFLPEDQVGLWFAASDVVLIPQERAMVSGVVELALDAGRPMVLVDDGCHPEVVPRDGGFWFTHISGDGVLALKQALTVEREVLRAMERRVEQASRARSRRWDLIAAETLNLYRRVLRDA